MYPADVLNLFPPHARTNTVFVAMSFDRRFEAVWKNVLEPAVSDVKHKGEPLAAYRVDLSKKSDSIITEIVRGIAAARLVLADVSTIGWTRRWIRKGRPIRNANVMYELGIAHAARIPEEVVVVRSDGDPLDFDIAGVRVHRYSPMHSEARETVRNLLTEALKSVDQRRSIAVQRALQTLDPEMYLLLNSFVEVPHPVQRTFGDVLGSMERVGAICRLLEGGMLRATFGPLPDDFMVKPMAEFVRYRKTPFGADVFAAAREEMGFHEALGRWLQTGAGKEWLDQQAAAARARQAGSGSPPNAEP
jgi:hypothetical protein